MLKRSGYPNYLLFYFFNTFISLIGGEWYIRKDVFLRCKKKVNVGSIVTHLFNAGLVC